MVLRSDSAAGVRFLASVREGRGLKRSGRAAGVHPEVGYRWLRESFLALRADGLSSVEAQTQLGIFSARVAVWDGEHAEARGDGRHHLRLPPEVESEFWARYFAGWTLADLCGELGVGRSTAYRWLRLRFLTLRVEGVSARSAGRRLRVGPRRAGVWEAERRQVLADARAEQAAAERRARRTSARHVELLTAPRNRGKVELREARYWELMRRGMTNTAACRLLG